MATTFPSNLVSVKYLSRVFHQLPEKLVEKLRAMGIEAITHLDGVPYYGADVVDRLNDQPGKTERLVPARSRRETT